MDTADLGRLLSLISHEVRGPLGVIRGYMRLLEQRGPELSDPQRHAVTAALKASDRATEVLTQVSLLAELARQETIFNFESMPLAKVLAAATDAVVLPPSPKLALEVNVVGSLDVRADAGLLRIALTSLIAALVRAHHSDVKVTITTIEQDRALVAPNRPHSNTTPPDADNPSVAGVAIDINTADTNRGVEQPLDVTRGGHGLDLPLAEAMITAHGGTVREYRRGSQLTAVVVWMPLAR